MLREVGDDEAEDEKGGEEESGEVGRLRKDKGSCQRFGSWEECYWRVYGPVDKLQDGMGEVRRA